MNIKSILTFNINHLFLNILIENNITKLQIKQKMYQNIVFPSQKLEYLHQQVPKLETCVTRHSVYLTI